MVCDNLNFILSYFLSHSLNSILSQANIVIVSTDTAVVKLLLRTSLKPPESEVASWLKIFVVIIIIIIIIVVIVIVIIIIVCYYYYYYYYLLLLLLLLLLLQVVVHFCHEPLAQGIGQPLLCLWLEMELPYLYLVVKCINC